MQVLSGLLSSIVFLIAVTALVLTTKVIGIIIGIIAVIALIAFMILSGTMAAIVGGGLGVIILLALIIYAIFKKPTNQTSIQTQMR